MSENVKRRRTYRSTKRAEQVVATRHVIVEAAGTLFTRDGYSSTSMPAIAREAGVAVETIYRGFGNKAGLFKAVIHAALAGGVRRADVPVEDRPAIRAVIDEPDPRRQIELYAATQPGIHRRAGALLRALRGGAAGDEALAALWYEMEATRHEGQGRLVSLLAERGALRPGLDVDEARDAFWALCSLAVRDMLIEARGWPEDRYLAWLTKALQDLLLPPAT
jgi:AcrR family transcriptional regulator